MIGLAVAIYCLASGSCQTVNVMFRGAATPAACERAIAEVEPGLIAEGYARASLKCDGPGEGA